MAQQKQLKQLLLTDDKNIFTYCFQSIQRLQLNFNTYGIRNFMHTKHSGDKAKLRIFSFILQRQSIQPNFMNQKYQIKKNNPNNQNNSINVGFTTNTKFVLLQLRQRKFWSIHIQISTSFKKFIFNHFRTCHPSPICKLHHSRKTCTWPDEKFCTFIHPYMNPLPFLMVDCQYSFWVFTLKKSRRRER